MSDLPPPPASPPPPEHGAGPPPPPGYGYSGYGYPAYGYPPTPATKTNGHAIAALVCGIVGFSVCQLASIAAIPLGISALRQIKQSEGHEEGRGFAIAGIALGAAGLALVLLIVSVFTLLVLTGPDDQYEYYDDDPYGRVVPVSEP
jgi:hypothetical protein